MMDYDNEEWEEALAPDNGNNRYSNAYGEYRGGYGSGGGFSPGKGFGPGGGFGPRPHFELGRGYGPSGPRGSSWGPPPIPPPPPMMGRGFGARGPPLQKATGNEKAFKFLIRCGVARQHLRNLSREMLDSIKPDYCGLCGHSFDTFATARIHYLSKNHLKAQKKWLTHNNEMLYSNSAQLPFKSRDLYCELCDVHITSKTHSDSHYLGKSHRSIVDGRRNPKNPFLLQDGMQNRLDQLIRREKKHLKAADEAEEQASKHVVTEKFDEPVPELLPELYCSICKTSVTCTEQMTMHLNGKKHLTKEKSHILRMMRSSNNAQDNGSEQAFNTQENFANETALVQNKGAVEQSVVANQSEGAVVQEVHSYDWGNGTGSWE